LFARPHTNLHIQITLFAAAGGRALALHAHGGTVITPAGILMVIFLALCTTPGRDIWYKASPVLRQCRRKYYKLIAAGSCLGWCFARGMITPVPSQVGHCLSLVPGSAMLPAQRSQVSST